MVSRLAAANRNLPSPKIGTTPTMERTKQTSFAPLQNLLCQYAKKTEGNTKQSIESIDPVQRMQGNSIT
jgi:hypothetical protein